METMKIQDLSLWSIFYQAGLDLNFATTAKKLNLAPSTITKKISELENILQVRLFTRTTRKVQLSHEGLGLFPKISMLLEEIQEVEEHLEFGNEISGTIRINCVSSVAHRHLPSVLKEFRNNYPKVLVEFESTDIIYDLVSSQIDIAIRVEGPKLADYVFRPLIPNKLVCVATPKYLKERGKKITTPNDLLNHHLLKLKVYDDCKFIRQNLRLGDCPSKKNLTCESGMFLTTLCLEHMGVAVRSLWDVQEFINQKVLVRVLGDHPLEDFGILNAVIPTKRLMSKRVRAFLDLLLKHAKTWPR